MQDVVRFPSPTLSGPPPAFVWISNPCLRGRGADYTRLHTAGLSMCLGAVRGSYMLLTRCLTCWTLPKLLELAQRVPSPGAWPITLFCRAVSLPDTFTVSLLRLVHLRYLVGPNTDGPPLKTSDENPHASERLPRPKVSK